MSFFNYHQNNSGGSWEVDENRGISVDVIIEACSAGEADDRARALGIYFNGCDTGMDCNCCGDRWSPCTPADAKPEPMVYDDPVAPNQNFPAQDEQQHSSTKWCDEGVAEGFIHYLDGRIEPFFQTTNERKDLDGTYGWGVQFSKENKPTVFLIGKNGWDEGGNCEAPGHRSETGNYDTSWTKPTKPTVQVCRHDGRNYGWGSAWFPTEGEAQAFAKAMELTNKVMSRELQKTKRRMLKEIDAELEETTTWLGPLVTEAMKMWNKT